MATSPTLKDRFEGCLLGLAIGDALGGILEAQGAESIRERFGTVQQLIDYPQDEIWYTGRYPDDDRRGRDADRSW